MIDRGPQAPSEEWVKVTPDVAQAWLDKNENNRKLTSDRVIRFAEDMEAGRWVDYHPHGVSFDNTGRLIDGQHRLHAVVLSGVPITMRVTMNLPPEMHAVFDLGTPRTAGEILRRQGVKDPNQAAAIAVLVHWYDQFPNYNWNGARHPSKTQINEFVLEHEQEMAEHVHAAHAVYRSAGIPRGPYGALRLLVQRHGLMDAWDQWHEGMATGSRLDKGDPRLTLRNYFTNVRRNKERKDTWSRQKHLANLIRGYEFYLTGRQVHIFRFEPHNLPMPTLPTAATVSR